MRLHHGNDIFEFNFNNIGRALWVVELIRANDERGLLSHSDPFPSERAARHYARTNIHRWRRLRGLGWCMLTDADLANEKAIDG